MEVEALVIQGPMLITVLSQVKKLDASVLVLSQRKPSPFCWYVLRFYHEMQMRARPHVCTGPLSQDRPVERRESIVAGIAHRTVAKSIVLYQLKFSEFLPYR